MESLRVKLVEANDTIIRLQRHQKTPIDSDPHSEAETTHADDQGSETGSGGRPGAGSGSLVPSGSLRHDRRASTKYRPEHQLEELRNLQEQLTQEKAEWQKKYNQEI